MEMYIDYCGGKKFCGRTRGLEIFADQPLNSGAKDEAMTPTEIFVFSLGACTGMYAQGYCDRNGLSAEGLKIRAEWDKAQAPASIGFIRIEIMLPPGFPSEHREGLLRVAEKCFIHNTLEQPPRVEVTLAREPEVL